MTPITVVQQYVFWHYSVAYGDLLHIWYNYLWFINHLFSVPEVLSTWFSPWKLMQEEKGNIFLNPSDFFANIAVNMMMRLVGFVIRTALIVIALICFAVILLCGFFFLALWTVLPFLVIASFLFGIRLFLLGA